MNVAQAATLTLPGVPVYSTTPDAPPPTPYIVISEITDGRERDYYADAQGHRAQVRTLTLLLTLYGAPWDGRGDPLTPLRPLYRSLRTVGDLITEHPGLPPLAGVTRGAELPPQGPRKGERAWCGVRLLCKYVE